MGVNDPGSHPAGKGQRAKFESSNARVIREKPQTPVEFRYNALQGRYRHHPYLWTCTGFGGGRRYSMQPKLSYSFPSGEESGLKGDPRLF